MSNNEKVLAALTQAKLEGRVYKDLKQAMLVLEPPFRTPDELAKYLNNIGITPEQAVQEVYASLEAATSKALKDIKRLLDQRLAEIKKN